MASKKQSKTKRKRPPPIPDGPAIYVASLSDYNAGRLHGWWIDVTLGEDHIREQIQDMLAASSDPYAEEWAIHDYQGFGSLRLDEHENLETLAEFGSLIEEHGELVAELVAHYGGLVYLDEAIEALNDRYAGEADSLEDWAIDYLDEIGALSEVPEYLRRYFGYEEYANDLEMSGDIFTIEVDGKLHVFRGH